MTVYSPRYREAIGFDKRRLQQRGYFLTGEQIRARNVLLGFQLASAPSIRVINMVNGRPVLRGRRNCMPTVYLDGFPVPSDPMNGATDDLDLLISVREIGGAEVYPDFLDAPAQFSRGGFCAVILLWSRQLVP